MSAEVVIIAGDYGSGKSFSTINMPEEESFLVSVTGKPLPYVGWKNKWRTQTLNKGTEKELKQNMYVSMDPQLIVDVLIKIHNARPHVKYFIIDDTTYTMASEFMKRRKEKSYEKWTDLSWQIWSLLREPMENFRDGTIVFFMWHTEEVETSDELGSSIKRRCKTLGRSLNKNVGIEGLCRMVLFTHVEPTTPDPRERYFFATQNTGDTTAKSPYQMFGKTLIPNDLAYVAKRIEEYDNQGIIEEWADELGE